MDRRWYAGVLAAGLVAAAVTRLGADTPSASGPATTAASTKRAGLRMTWAEADHASGIYHAKSEASLTVLVDNPTDAPADVGGQIAFGPQPEPGGAFEATSVTPVTGARLLPGERARIPLALAFAAAGTYELRWEHGGATTAVENGAGMKLRCIFAPRTGGREEPPWLAVLPSQAATAPGWIKDYAAQTSVRRFLLDERFAFDEAQNIGLGFGASLGAGEKQIETMLADVASAKGSLVLRVHIPGSAAADARRMAAFREYLSEAVKRSRGTLKAVAICPEALSGDADECARFHRFYLAGYEAVKNLDRKIVMLGAGNAEATEWLLSGTGAEDLQAYVDAVAITDMAAQPGVARRAMGARAAQTPLWLLPGASGPMAPAAALADGVAVIAVPAPELDRGVTAHLLGGAAFLRKVPVGGIEGMPEVLVFQGDGYAVVAVAGLAAGTRADALYPGLARGRTVVTPRENDQKPPGMNLEVSDDTRTMRVVDGEGAPVDCRVGDSLYVPVGQRSMYVLEAGLAEDLAGSLRPSVPNHMPVAEVTATLAEQAVKLKVHNITREEIGGSVRLVAPDPEAPAVLGSGELPALQPGGTAELVIDVDAAPKGPVVVELTTAKVTQRTTVVVGK